MTAGLAHISLAPPHKEVQYWEMLLMFWLLALSGNQYITRKLDVLISLSAVLPLWYMLKHREGVISYRTLTIFVFFLGYEYMHSVMFSLDYTLTIIKLGLVLLFAFTCAKLFSTRFVPILTKTMVWVSYISFVFTFLCYVPGLGRMLHDTAMKVFYIDIGFKAYVNPTFILYTFSHEYFTGELPYARNAGMFWESGAFAVFLLVTLFLHYSSKQIRAIGDLFDKQATVLIIATVSTTSTTGFFALVVLLFYYTAQTKSAFKYVLVVLMGLSFYIAFMNVDFLGGKVAKQLDESGTRNNRFGAFLMDLEDIAERPMLGSSRRLEVVFGTTEASMETRRPNGFSNFIRNYGLVYFTFYFVLVYAGFNAILKFHGNPGQGQLALFGVVLLWVVSFSELIFDLAFFKALVFLAPIYTIGRQAATSARTHELHTAT